MTRVLSVSADRSRRGILAPGAPGYARQKAYAEKFGALDIIGFSRRSDGFVEHEDGALHTYPTRSRSRFFYVWDAIRIGARLPWPDVVSAQDPFETGLAAYFIAHFTKRPLHIQIHTDFLSPAYARHSFLNRMRVHIARFVLRRASRVRVVSERIATSLRDKYRIKAPITVLPIFADLARLRGQARDESLAARFAHFSKRFLFVGRLEPEKHPCLALRAFAKAAPKDACLIVVGAGSETGLLERMAHTLGVAERVFLEGESESVPYYSIADLVLVTSRYEGYGLVIVEALAAGKPVLSTDVGVARESGAIVADDAHFAEALASWSSNGPRQASLAHYPYVTFESYVEAYCSDVQKTALSSKKQAS